MINFTDELRVHNLKATPQRLAISDAMFTHRHINIDALYTIMLKKFNSISLATIYKNINLMLQNSFIQEVKIPNNKSVYELTKKVHSHLVCQTCNEVSDIDLELQTVLDEAQAQSDFLVSKTDLVLSGICKKCR
ncbi:Fur family transcriptional regulator [Sulfurimonas sp.]|uniref:Fur family transcriptional regulator n=1 Tax=Sulfurimonas sp. TaxID=2022749 RepID=UPI002AB23AB4|nr:Fur family transcriptional regulator [Sulfurimonas sp.]